MVMPTLVSQGLIVRSVRNTTHGFFTHGPGYLPEPSARSQEFYLVLTPGSQWKLDDGDWFDVNAGDLILHDAQSTP